MAIQVSLIIFDASLVSHMTNDLIRNYNATEDEMILHMETLIKIIRPLNPVVFYLSSDNVRKRVIEARQSRGQASLSEEKIKFWEKRKQLDFSILPKLSVRTHIMNISDGKWNCVISDIISNITR